MTTLRSLSLKSLLLGFAALVAIAVPQAAFAEPWFELAAPGTDIDAGRNRPKDVSLAKWLKERQWYSVSLKDSQLFIQQVTKTTEPEWITVNGKDADKIRSGEAPTNIAKPQGLALSLHEGALFAFRVNGGAINVTPGKLKSAVKADILRQDWSDTAVIGGSSWKFFTKHQKRTDRALLAGSMEIWAQRESDPEVMLLPKAAGMAFQRQELLWLGDINNDGQPDLVLKRTSVTGHIDYVFLAASMFGMVNIDPDQPQNYFSSGVEPEGNGFSWHTSQPLRVLAKQIVQGSFTVGETQWMEMMKDIDPDLPKVLIDRQLKIQNESIRFTLEYLPRARQAGSERVSSNGTWEGDVLVKSHFRGKSQILFQATQPDGSGLSISVGTILDKPSIVIGSQPHYNNSFVHYWSYEDGPVPYFKRLRVEQFQGC